MTTVPGFSSRSTDSTVRQLPQRDEAAMTVPGWSNTDPDHKDRIVEAAAPPPAEAEAKVVEAGSESKTVRKAVKKASVGKSD